ncbi:uncharacterized protein LOC141643792 [Silene latifolia]|uniref:uncharacterized protein LOC141643792 n=1 Tax=Silene latifolia TaxID=37657 RepID=UPI003D76C6B3
MTTPTIEEQLAAALQKLAQSEKLEKYKGSSSKIQPGSPFSSIIKHFDFSSFGSPSGAKKAINIDDDDTPKDDNEKPDETGAAVMMVISRRSRNSMKSSKKIPGVPSSMEEATPESYVDSPFIDEIVKVDLPKKFVILSIRTYHGTSDPQNHIKDESLRSFLARFNKEKVSIPRCDIGTAVEAFRQGLLPNSDLYVELTKYPCHSFEDVQAKTLAYIRLEEDKSYKFGGSCNPKDYDMPNRKSGGKGSNYRSGLIKRLDNMGLVVRWPRKSDNPNQRKDHTKWCEFHMDMGHTTEDCFTLRKKVAYLLKAGYLKDLIKARGRIEETSKNNQEQKQERNLPPPPPLYEVKFINGGSESCGLTSSAAKKITRTPQTKSPCKPDNIPPITFSDCDLVGIIDVHHDGLVISMQIRTANVRRILVDGGSLVNLIMLDVLKVMKIKEDQITKKSSVLVGFSGETKSTLGEIYLPT